MAGMDEEILARPIQLVDEVIINADSAQSFKHECIQLKTIAVNLAALLREAVHASNELYQRPALRIIDDTEKVLDNALALVAKCRVHTFMMRIFFIIIPPNAFKETSTQLENAIHNVSWLLHVSTPAKARCPRYEYFRLPPIVSNKPGLARIWVDIAILHAGTLEKRSHAAASLLALHFNRDGGLIIEEGGVAPLLKLAREGPTEGQEKAVKSIGFMCRNSKSVQHIVKCGACPVFAKILEDGRRKVQSAVAWAASKMTAHHPKCQDDFVKNNVISLGLIWEQVAILYTGTLEERLDAAVSLGSLARDNDRYGGLIIEEGGVEALLKLAEEGHREGQEHAAKCIGFLCRDSKSVEHVVNCGACFVFERILEDGHVKVQSVVAWAVSEMATHHPIICQHHFARNNVVCLLLNHLAFATIQEDKWYEEDDKQMISCMDDQNGNELSTQIHKVVTNTLPTKHLVNGELQNSHKANDQTIAQPQQHAKVQMKIMAAKALWHLCKGNVSIYRNITESRALLCFALLLENGCDDEKYYSAMALMEITAMAEQNVELRQFGFDPSSSAVKAVVEQLLKIVEKENRNLIIPSLKAIGHLAWTFKATEVRLIASLVKLLDEREEDVTMEALIALDKFACPDNLLHDNHCKAIIEAGGIKHLVQLVYFGEYIAQILSLILLCHIVLHVFDSEVLAQEEVLTVLEISLKRSHLMEEPNLQSVLPKARNRLKLYQYNFID